MATTHFNPRGLRPADRAPRDDGPSITVDDIRFGAKPDPCLFSDIAEAKAEAVYAGGRSEVNKSSQLRRFYDELVMWHDKVGFGDAQNDQRFTELQPYIYMLKAKVAYARGRGHVDANFEALLRRLLDQSTDAATLRQAKLFLEAFMAFYKVRNNK